MVYLFVLFGMVLAVLNLTGATMVAWWIIISLILSPLLLILGVFASATIFSIGLGIFGVIAFSIVWLIETVQNWNRRRKWRKRR